MIETMLIAISALAIALIGGSLVAPRRGNRWDIRRSRD
jgi:hypothetical protein